MPETLPEAARPPVKRCCTAAKDEVDAEGPKSLRLGIEGLGTFRLTGGASYGGSVMNT
jgi:hypothetical protein